MLFGKSSSTSYWELPPDKLYLYSSIGTFGKKLRESSTHISHTYERIDKVKQSKWFKCSQIKRII